MRVAWGTEVMSAELFRSRLGLREYGGTTLTSQGWRGDDGNHTVWLSIAAQADGDKPVLPPSHFPNTNALPFWMMPTVFMDTATAVTLGVPETG